MKRLSCLIILALGSANTVLAQASHSAACKFTVGQILFTRCLNDSAAGAKVSGNTLTLTSQAQRDTFHDPDRKATKNAAPSILTKVDNTKPFTFTVAVKPTLTTTYDAGTVFIWVDDNVWLKMAMELDERHKTRMVTVRTDGTSDDNNHDVVTAKTVFFKVSSDTRSIGFYYSLDRVQWQLIRVFRNAYPATIWVGPGAQSPLGSGMSATFSDFALSATSVKDFRLGQ